MDPITLTVLFKGIGMLIALVAGIFTVRYGYFLYQDGVGHRKDRAAFEVGNIKIGAHSVGSVVMSTAFLWGIVGIWLSPNITRNNNGTKVYSFELPDTKLDSIALTSGLLDTPEAVLKNSVMLRNVFQTTAFANPYELNGLVRINGEVAALQPSSVDYFTSEDGSILITALAQTDANATTLTYLPMINEQNQIVFEPEGISKTKENEDDSPNK